jgi:hypothetical protein
MTCGLQPFFMGDGGLTLALQPCLPSDFFTDKGIFAFNFLGCTRVTYHNKGRKNTFGSDAALVQSYHITYKDGTIEEITGKHVSGKSALAIRNGEAVKISVVLE